MKHPFLAALIVLISALGLRAEERDDAALPTLPKLKMSDPLPAAITGAR